MVVSAIVFSLFSVVKAKKAKPDKYVEYEIFDPNIKTTPVLKEPPKGDPNAVPDKTPTKPKETNKVNTTAKSSNKTVIDPKAAEEKVLKEKERLDSLRQDSLAQALADSLAKKRLDDSLAAVRNKGQMGTANGTGSSIDTSHHKPIGGPTEFGRWLSEALRPKYTAEFKKDAVRGTTFTLRFNVNSDSTISNIELLQKAYFGMDDIIIETIKSNPKKWAPYKNEKGEIIKSQTVKIPVKLHPVIGPKNN